MDWNLHDILVWTFIVSEWIIRLCMLFYIPYKRTPSSASSWLLLIFFMPLVGFLLYMAIGRPYLPKGRKEKFQDLPNSLAPIISRLSAQPQMAKPEVPPQLEQAVLLAKNLGRMPILGGNDVELLRDYNATIKRITEDIKQAKHHVHMLYYIFAVDETTQPVIDALADAVKRGVQCRVLIDFLGSSAWRKKLTKILTEFGVQVIHMLPVGLFRRSTGRFDLRNHRKIVVIDGKIGYTGSQNMVAAKFKEGITYEELVARITGPAVLELQLVFVSDWYLDGNEVLLDPEIFPDPEETGSVIIQTLPSGPSMATLNNQRFIVDLIYGARFQVDITTPYFVPDEALLQALQTAVLRGVTVNIFVSKKEDQLLVSLAQKSYYQELLESGVNIYQYKDNFLHAKHLSIDDHVCLVGSSNMDIRSFALNAEISMLFYDVEVTARLQDEEDRYLEHSEQLTLEEWNNRSTPVKLFQALGRLLSPLL